MKPTTTDSYITNKYELLYHIIQRKIKKYDIEMKKTKSVRFDERTWTLLNELSKKTETPVSVIIRSIVLYSIENLLDKDGNFYFGEEKEE